MNVIMPKESVVETYLDDFRKQCTTPIWEVKPKDIGGKSTTGKPDRIWLINGGLWGIEAKRIMSKTNKSTLPTVIQTKELNELIGAGGAGCVIDLKNMELFTKMLTICEYRIERFLRTVEYKERFSISNWGRYPDRIKF